MIKAMSKPRANQSIQAVLFDLDCTLIDTGPDFIRILTSRCDKHNHVAPSAEAIREQVSAGSAMVKLMFGDELANVVDTDPILLLIVNILDTYEADSET